MDKDVVAKLCQAASAANGFGYNAEAYKPIVERVLKELAEMNVWLPIETAPKDGLRIILFCDRVFGSIRTGYWKSIVRTIDEQISYDASGWLMDGFDHPNNMEPFTPTHWKPLPVPPGEE